MIDTEHPATAARPVAVPRRGVARRLLRRRNLPLLVAAVVMALIALWLLVARQGVLAAGPVHAGGPTVTLADDGVSATRYVAQASPGGRFSFVSSVRNDGRLPVTLLGLSPRNSTILGWVERTRFAEPPEGSDVLTLPPASTAEHVTLAPGEEALVLMDFRIPDCVYPIEGFYREALTLRLSTRVLGVVRTQAVPIADRPLVVNGAPPASTLCPMT